MKIKKVISLMLALCMVLSLAPIYAVDSPEGEEATQETSKYAVDDEFSADDSLIGWSMLENTTTNAHTASVVAESDGSSNYVLQYSAPAADGTKPDAKDNKTHYVRTLDEPITFKNGQNVVIKTRFRHSNADSARVYLKFNVTEAGIEEARQYFIGANLHTLLNINKKQVSIANGIAATWQSNMVGLGTPFNAVEANNWITATVTIKGDSKTADFVIENDAGGKATYSGYSIEQPKTYSSSGTSLSNIIEDKLENVAFGFREGPDTMQVDYLKIWTEQSAEIKCSEKIMKKGSIDVKLDAASPVDFSDCVSVKDSNGTDVSDIQKKYDNGVVSVMPKTAWTDNGEYTVTVNKTALADKGYTFADSSTDYTVNVSEYLISDDFGNNDTNGWVSKFVAEKGSTSNTLGTEKIDEADNYALKYATAAETSDRWGWGYAYVQREMPYFALKEGTDVVVKTRLKQVGDSGRSFLKFNFEECSDVKEYNYCWGTLLGNNKTNVLVPNGYKSDGYANFDTSSPVGGSKTVATYLNNWVEAELRIHPQKDTDTGVTKVSTMTLVLKDESGKTDTYENLNISQSSHSATSNWVEDVINDFAFRLRDVSTLYVDYFRVYTEAQPIAGTIDVDGENIALNGSANVYLKSTEKVDFSDCVSLYDEAGSTVVEADKEYDEEECKVSVKPATSPADTTTYTLKIDSGKMTSLGIKVTNETEYKVCARKASEAFSEDFESGVSEWKTDKATTDTKPTVEQIEESGNKFLRVSTSNLLKKDLTDSRKLFNVSRSIDSGFMMDADAYTVFEAKIRTNGSNYRKILRLNADFSWDEEAKTTHSWWTMNYVADNIAPVHTCYAESTANGKATPMYTYDKNIWYTVRTVYDNAARKVGYYVFDSDGTLVSKHENQSLTADNSAWWFNYNDEKYTDRETMRYLENISIAFRSNAESALSSAETFDIDDIKLYNASSVSDLISQGAVNVEIADATTGSVAESIPISGGSYKTKVNYSGLNGKESSFVVMTALYKDDSLVSFASVDEYTGSNIDKSGTVVEVPAASGECKYTIKVFVWDSLDSLKPLTAVKSISLADD